MKDAYLAPYLNLNGKCREAMEFYHGVLGGTLEMSTFGETMPGGKSEEEKDKIMHAIIDNGALTIMASDGVGDDKYTIGNHISLSIAGTDGDKLKKFWDGLSADGKIVEPLVKAPWGDEFGMFTDKYGMFWMINISAKKD